jgi:Tol biopolymer transport system component
MFGPVKARFEREAQAIAALNHPHICVLHDVGEAVPDRSPQSPNHPITQSPDSPVSYLVMEYLEGQTLAQRLEKGALPLDQALHTGIELADALDKAHRQGVVHRDLKPGNVMMTKSGAKLLDFGLAKLRPDAADLNGASALPTNAPLTEHGTILGTIQYMAPEQLEGKEADARTDIFAFGAVLYEIVTGERAFQGGSRASLIAAILDRDPAPISSLQPLAPPLLERIVKKSLAKSPDDRWQSAGDLLDELKWTADSLQVDAAPAAATPPARRRIVPAWAVAATGVALIAGAAFGIWYARSPAVAEQVRFEIVTPNMPDPRDVTISPDGRSIAFVASTDSGTALFVRRLELARAQQLADTDGATAPFWSPDSQHLAFFAGGRIKRVAVSGGPVQNLCSAQNLAGGTWNDEGVIIFSAGRTLYRVSAAGGDALALRHDDEPREDVSHLSPHFLPDGRRYLFTAWSFQQASRAVYVGSLDSEDTQMLFPVASKVTYAAPGYLLFHREGTLVAQGFNPDSLALTGEPVPVAENISYDVLGAAAAFASSQNGALVYYAGGGPAVSRRFLWFDRSGNRLETAGDPAPYTSNFDLSPDGSRIAVARQNTANIEYDIWIVDWDRQTSSRLTFDPALSANGNVVWSPDGLQVAFSSERSGNRDIFVKSTSGAGSERALIETPLDEWPEDWSKDGQYLLYGVNETQRAAVSFGDLHALPLSGGKPIAVATSPFGEDEPRFSFDGRWIAYNSAESGIDQVYLVSFPDIDRKHQISTGGGVQPRWRQDGRELFFLGLDGTLMAVDIRSDSGLEWGVPHPLFDTGLDAERNRDQFAATPDGQRFLVQLPTSDAAAVPISVVLNWTASLTRPRMFGR